MTEANNLLFQFTEHLKVLNRSEATIKAYTANVRQFLEEEKRNIKTITKSDMEAYVATIYEYRMADGKGYSQGSIAVKIRSLKRFFEFLESANIIFINPMEYIPEPTPDRRLPRNILTVSEMEKLLDQANLGLKTGIRDRAVLEVLYSTGARLSELCSLTIYDADLQGRMLRINKGKGQKDRVVPLGRHAVRFLREYITKIRPHFTRRNRTSRVLFVNQLGRPLSRQMVQIMVRTNAKKAGIKKRSVPIPCVTPLPASWSKTALMWWRCRRCLAMPTFPPPRAISRPWPLISKRYMPRAIPGKGTRWTGEASSRI